MRVCGKLGRAVGLGVTGGRRERHAWPMAAEEGKAGAALKAERCDSGIPEREATLKGGREES